MSFELFTVQSVGPYILPNLFGLDTDMVVSIQHPTDGPIVLSRKNWTYAAAYGGDTQNRLYLTPAAADLYYGLTLRVDYEIEGAQTVEAIAGLIAAVNQSQVAMDASLGGGVWRASVSELVADTDLTYTAGQMTSVAAGGTIRTLTEGFAYEVADSAATDHHLATAGGVKLYVLPLFGGDHGRVFVPEQFGAVAAARLYIDTANARWCTDAGLTTAAVDYTAELQACVDAADVVMGGGGHYQVSDVQVLSNKTVRDLFLYAAPQSTDVQESPIYFGRDTSFGRSSQSIADVDHPVENVTLENVHIDGAREIQTNLVTADGGRYGFRFRGYHRNIRLIGCSAVRCATDALEIHRGIGTLATSSDEHRPVRDIVFRDCEFDWNRRHGASGNGLDGILFDNCTFRHNGKNADGTTTPQTAGTGPTDGENGAISAGQTYGNGIDFESNPTPGGCIRNFTMKGCTLTNNVRDGVLFFNAVDQSLAGFLPSQNIYFVNCRIDRGDDNVNGDYAATFTSSIANKAGPSVFENVQFLNCDLDGIFTMRSVSGMAYAGGRLWGADPNNDGFGVFDYATAVSLAPDRTNIFKIVAPNVADVAMKVEIEGSFPYAGETLAAGAQSAAYILNAPGVTSADFVELMNSGITGATNTQVSVQHERGYGTNATQDDQIVARVVNDGVASRTTAAGRWYWRARKTPWVHEYVSNAAFASGLVADGALTLAVAGLIPGATYRLRFQATGVGGGTATPSLGGADGTAISAAGMYFEDIVAGSGTAELAFTADASWSGSIVNVSVNRVS